MNRKYYIISFFCLLFGVVIGLLSNDLLIGSTTLVTGILCAYFASEGRRINYIFGLINYILMGYVSLKNHLFGLFIFYIFLFSPLQIKGFITWKNKSDDKNNLEVRSFTLKNSIIITITCIVGSFLVGYILNLIPKDELSFMDASSNCVNLCGVILMILRFRESWWIWLINNIIDLSIWIIVFINNGENSFMMLLVSISYLIINIYGIIKWNIIIKQGSLWNVYSRNFP